MVLGVSLDNAASHRQFRSKLHLPFDLLIDPGMKISRLYDVDITNLLVVKLTERVTYLIGKDGIIHRAFESVRPAGHASEVLSCILSRKKN